jgi:Sec-independent protein secretion pathway component TatC
MKVQVKRKYKVLRALTVDFKVSAWVSLLLGLVVAVAAFVAGATLAPALEEFYIPSAAVMGVGAAVAIIVLLVAVFWFTLYYAASDSLKALLDVEENTRRTVELVSRVEENTARLTELLAGAQEPSGGATP